MEERSQGVVEFLNEEKGYGFVKLPGYDRGVFFHAKDMRHVPFDKLRRGDVVEIEGIKSTEKGYNATAVFLVS